MNQVYNVYCDESCHLEKDNSPVMVLGLVWVDTDQTRLISSRIREIKQQHGLSKDFEIKWTKVSPAKIDFYLNIVDYFFDNSFLHSRCLVIPDKTKLNHKTFKQSHDEWYYKMYFNLLKAIFYPNNKYRIYIDIKDTLGGKKISKLQEVLCNNMLDFDREVIQRIQLVRSHESELMQLTDLIIGAVGYTNKGETTSTAKLQLIDRIQQRSNYSLKKSTLLQEQKFNVFIWNPQEIETC